MNRVFKEEVKGLKNKIEIAHRTIEVLERERSWPWMEGIPVTVEKHLQKEEEEMVGIIGQQENMLDSLAQELEKLNETLKQSDQTI